MISDEILIDNKLIAEFIENDKQCKEAMKYFDNEEFGTIYFDTTGLKYHKSWDWLMPVVEKIWDIIKNKESLFYFTVNKELTIFSKAYGENNINTCYSAVIEFINWYNKQKS